MSEGVEGQQPNEQNRNYTEVEAPPILQEGQNLYD